MNGKQYRILMVLAFVAGFLGGVLSTRILPPRPPSPEKAAKAPRTVARRPLTAKKPAETPATVSAEQFCVVDKQGKIRVYLGMMGDEPLLQLKDKSGNLRATLSLLPDGSPNLTFSGQQCQAALSATMDQPSLTFIDKKGKVVFQAP